MIDAHIHFEKSDGFDKLNEYITRNNLDGICLQCIPKGDKKPVEKDAFEFRKRCAVPVYIFGGISRDVFKAPRALLRGLLVDEITRLLNLGCDGIKMLEGKPDVRKNHSIPDFDAEEWEGFWERMEEEGIPLTFHVNDPEEFWDTSQVTEFARKAGWFYDDTYMNNQEQYRQVEAVLERHPQLNVIFPHYLFFSKQLDRLGKMLDSFPNMKIDITPGSEQYFNLSDRIKEARAFFVHYQDRIIYGTDVGARTILSGANTPLSMDECKERVRLVRTFLERQGKYELVPDGIFIEEGGVRQMEGLGLGCGILEKIYQDNFLNTLSKHHRRDK